MKLYSKRLAYLRYAKANLPEYLQLVTDQRVMKYIAGRALTEEEGTLRFEKALATNSADGKLGNFMAFTRTGDQYIGLAKLVITGGREAEIGYALLPAFWGQGYATEMVTFFIEYARSLRRFDRLIALVDPDNPVSIRILDRFGFTPYQEGAIHGLPVVYYERVLD